MSTYDKSHRSGYDATDRELNEALETLHRESPKVARAVQQRVHEGILQRLKELGTQSCHKLAEDLMSCMNDFGLSADMGLRRCIGQRDAVNECFRSVHTEENYQKLRLQMLRGELLQQHAEKTLRKVEAHKAHAPETISNWKPDYAWRYKSLADRLGEEEGGDAPASEFAFRGFSDGDGQLPAHGAADVRVQKQQQQQQQMEQQQQQQQQQTQPQHQEHLAQSQLRHHPHEPAGTTIPGDAGDTSGERVIPSTVHDNAKYHRKDRGAALELLRQQNQRTQWFRKNFGSAFVPVPPEFEHAAQQAGPGGPAAAVDIFAQPTHNNPDAPFDKYMGARAAGDATTAAAMNLAAQQEVPK